MERQGRMLLTMEEVSELTGLPRTRLKELARAGNIPLLKIGRRIYMRRPTLDRWLEELEVAAAAGMTVTTWR